MHAYLDGLSERDFLDLLRAVGVRLHRETGAASRGTMGFLAELDVIHRLGLNKAAALSAGFDATCPKTDRRLEIKSTVMKKGAKAAHGMLSRFPTAKDADALLIAVYDYDLNLVEVREVAMGKVEEYLAKPGSNARARRVAPAELLRRLGTISWTPVAPSTLNAPAASALD